MPAPNTDALPAAPAGDRSANDYRWFFKCPDGHKNRFFWADEWRRPAHPGPAGHQQHAAPQHGGLPQPPPPPQHGYDTHGSPRFGTAASQQDVPFHAGQPGHQQPLPYPQTPQQPRPAPPQMQSPPAAAGQAGGGPYATPQAPTGVGGGMLVQVQVRRCCAVGGRWSGLGRRARRGGV